MGEFHFAEEDLQSIENLHLFIELHKDIWPEFQNFAMMHKG